MASLTLRSVKGTPLTNNEIDTNFTNLNTEIATKLTSTDYTAADILTKIKTVDGTGSGLDADLLDGKSTSSANDVNTVVVRDASGNFSAGTITAALLSGDIQLQASKTISFEGSTDDAYETVLSVVDPTADRTILLPNVSGTIITTGDSGTVTNTMLTGSIANSKLANSSITIDGVSVSLGGTLSILDADNSWVGTQTFPDSKLVLKDNLDDTKVASFQLSNITPGATRSMIIPDETGVIATQGYVTTSISPLQSSIVSLTTAVNLRATTTYVNSSVGAVQTQVDALTKAKGFISFQPSTGGVWASKNLSVVRNGVGSFTIVLAGSIQNGTDQYAPMVGAINKGQIAAMGYGPNAMDVYGVGITSVSAGSFTIVSTRNFDGGIGFYGGGNDGNNVHNFETAAYDPARITVVVF